MATVGEEHAGRWRRWAWPACLAVLVVLGLFAYGQQLRAGLGITGLSRDVTWGLYIAQFTFLVGIAASAVIVVLPYYLHHNETFAKITILGELLAVSAVITALLFILVDMGQPARIINVFRYPTLTSIMFWDMLALGGYLVLNMVAALTTLKAGRDGLAPPAWLRPLMVLSIPWAISIHTVTAFLYSGLPGRPFWMTALLAPRFLASAFASGPALLILLCLIVRRLSRFDPGRGTLQQLAVIVTYAALITMFFLLVEVFTVFYSQIPEHMAHYRLLFGGGDGFAPFAASMWMSVVLAAGSIGVLLVPRYRQDERLLAAACAMIFVSIWIEKGLGLIVGGFVPTLMGRITTYVPTIPEVLITLGVWAVGASTLTIFYRMTAGMREAQAPLQDGAP